MSVAHSDIPWFARRYAGTRPSLIARATLRPLLTPTAFTVALGGAAPCNPGEITGQSVMKANLEQRSLGQIDAQA